MRFANVKTQLFYSLWLALSHWQTLLVEKTVIEELGESWPWSAKRCYLNSKVNSHSIWLNLFRLTYQHPVNSNYTCMPQPYRTEMDPSASKSWKHFWSHPEWTPPTSKSEKFGIWLPKEVRTSNEIIAGNGICKVYFCKQGTVALWSNASAWDWKIEGSNLAANFFFQWTTIYDARRRRIWKRKRKKARPRTTSDARARSLEQTRF